MSSLTLEQWRRVFGWSPWHFWGMAWGDRDTGVPVDVQCPSVVRKYAWQGVDHAGREDIQAAIDTAEARLFEYLHYRVGPQYVEATVDSGRPYMGNWMSWSGSLTLPDGYVQAAGIEGLTQIGTTYTPVLSDEDGDGIQETFTLTVATTTLPDHVAVYFQAVDRLDGDSPGDSYRIQPIHVRSDGATATITGNAYQLVRPIRYEGVRPVNLDPTQPGILATALEVYDRFTNADGQTLATAPAVLTWSSQPCWGWWSCCGTGAQDPALAIVQAIGRVSILNSQYGVAAALQSVYNEASAQWCGCPSTWWQPDRIHVRYLAGKPLANGLIDPALATVVARLAAAELGRPICACQTANKELDRWQFDLARTGGANDESYGAISQTDLSNPLGTRRGHVQAWRYIRQNAQLRGVAAN